MVSRETIISLAATAFLVVAGAVCGGAIVHWHHPQAISPIVAACVAGATAAVVSGWMWMIRFTVKPPGWLDGLMFVLSLGLIGTIAHRMWPVSAIDQFVVVATVCVVGTFATLAAVIEFWRMAFATICDGSMTWMLVAFVLIAQVGGCAVAGWNIVERETLLSGAAAAIAAVFCGALAFAASVPILDGCDLDQPLEVRRVVALLAANAIAVLVIHALWGTTSFQRLGALTFGGMSYLAIGLTCVGWHACDTLGDVTDVEPCSPPDDSCADEPSDDTFFDTAALAGVPIMILFWWFVLPWDGIVDGTGAAVATLFGGAMVMGITQELSEFAARLMKQPSPADCSETPDNLKGSQP